MGFLPFVLFIIVFTVTLKNAAKKKQQNTRTGTGLPSVPSFSTPSQRYQAKKAAQRSNPVQSYPTPTVPTAAPVPTAQPFAADQKRSRRQRADDHLCDPGQHDEETRQALETLQMLESDYQPYGSTVERVGMMTLDQFRRKQAELDDLRDAGIISGEEHREKLNEYRALLR